MLRSHLLSLNERKLRCALAALCAIYSQIVCRMTMVIHFAHIVLEWLEWLDLGLGLGLGQNMIKSLIACLICASASALSIIVSASKESARVAIMS
jgi:hypothetical protein